MDVKQVILFRIKEICREEGVDPKNFGSQVPPFKPNKEIHEGYTKMIGTFFSDIPLFIFEGNNGREQSREKKIKTLKIIEIHFEKTFRDYLQKIKKEYPKNIWKESEKNKNSSKRKKCFR